MRFNKSRSNKESKNKNLSRKINGFVRNGKSEDNEAKEVARLEGNSFKRNNKKKNIDRNSRFKSVDNKNTGSNNDFEQVSAGSKTFDELGLGEQILRALKGMKFVKPTPIQERAIPLALAGRDIIAGSETGSGKTLAFGAGIIQSIEVGKGVQALILTPTRELAEQVSKSLYAFARHHYLRVTAVYGGVSINTQIKALRKSDIVVATPGRLLDHMDRGTIKLNRVKTLVLDEADTMFDMGFIRDVEKIIKGCPKDGRQTLLFSATITGEIDKLAKRHTTNPVRLFTKSTVDPTKLKQIRYDVSKNIKFSLLVHLLKNEQSDLAMVFCNTRRSTDTVARNLKSQGIQARAIHGGFTQAQRTKSLQQFHSKRADVLICTDVAARGLDIKGVSHVYNYDVPNDSKQYIHRIGRTARAGKEGKAINLISKRDHESFAKVLSDNSITVIREKAPHVDRSLGFSVR